MLNQTDAHLEGGAATQTGVRPPEFVCAGDDLKDMLAELTRQFIAADQRNSAALSDMRGRLETLGRDAENVRDQVPEQFAPAFARIEDGVQMLAERIAAVGRERDIAKATASLAAAMARPMANTAPSVMAEPPMAAEPATAAAVAPAPQPVAAAAVAEPAAAMSRQAQVAAAPAMPATSIAGDAAAPWDADAAAALVDLYESGAGHVGERRPAEPKAQVSALLASAVAAAPVVSTIELPAAASSHFDQAWLEDKFAAVAARVEQSLAALRPDNAMAAFDGRLEQLEQRFGLAMEDVATRADVEGLRVVEAHLNELFTQFERAQAQLGRLDGIEQQLGDLMHQVSDERFGNLFAQFGGGQAHQGPTEEDIEAVAMAVADRVASRLPQPEAAPAAFDTAPIADLKRLVEGFVANQRETEEHTSTMLDTMQQAMIRMLDRMDAIENATPSYGAPAASFAPAAPAPAPAPAAAPTLRVEPRLGGEAPSAAAPEAAALPNRAPAQNKEDFRAAAVADARRAARKVATQSAAADDGEAVTAAAATSAGARMRRGAPAVDMSVAAEPAEAAAPVKARSRTPMMVAGIALLVAVGFLAATVGLNRGGKLMGGGAQTAQQQKAPLVIDNGSVETTAGDIGGGKEAPSNQAAQGSPLQSMPAARPTNKVEGGVEGLSNQADASSDRNAVRQEAAIQTPSTAAAAQALGIVVTTPTNSVPVNSDLARMRRERNMASLASQLAAVQANAPTVPASLLPTGATRISAEGPVEAASEPAAVSEMPPAQIGPISLRTAAQKGDPSAEFEVAARFAEGRGITQDFKQAMTWYQRSAQRGFAPAQYRLGTLFERGIGTKADVARAKVWYGRAAEQGHVKAMHNLAVLNAGRDGAGDYGAAVQWFTAAAERGLTDSQFNLGVLYESGLGMQRDLKQAYHWLSLAARGGDKEAARRRDAVRMKLEESEISAADAAVNAWHAQSVDPTVNEARAAGEMWKQRQAMAR